jgi:hypothetical protein
MVRHLVACAAMIAVSATAGWIARGPAPSPAAAAATPVIVSKPPIAVASEREEMSRRSESGRVREHARPPVEATVACTPPPAPADLAQTMHAIERGSEEQRFDGLMKARSAGMLVDERTLKTLYETDASERVRTAAFESFLEWRTDSPAALREALESALYVPSVAVQRTAKQRLDELLEMERSDALAPQGVP